MILATFTSACLATEYDQQLEDDEVGKGEVLLSLAVVLHWHHLGHVAGPAGVHQAVLLASQVTWAHLYSL